MSAFAPRWPPLSCLALLALLALVREASATEPSAPPERPLVEALRVEPDACLDRDALAAHIASWIHRDRIDRRIEITLSGGLSAPGGVELTLLRDGSVVGERRFEPRHVPCAEARAALGLAIALAIDSTLLQSLRTEPPAPPPPLASAPPAPAPEIPAPSPPPPVPPPPAPSAPSSPRPGWPGVAMSLDLVAMAGPLPSVVVGLAPAFELLLHRSFELRLSGLATTASTFAIGGGRVGVALYAGRLDACAALPLGPHLDAARLTRLRLHACAGVLGGALHTSVVSGLDPSPSPTAPWASAAVRFDARLALTSRFGLTLALDALVPLLRSDIDVTLRDGSVVGTHPLAPVGVAVGLGPHLLFD